MAVDSQRREPLELVRTPTGQSRIRLRATSTIVLNGGAVAVGSQRREPLEPVRTPSGQSRIRLRATSTIVLNGGAVAVGSQRREPLELVRTPTGQSRSDGSSATTGQSFVGLRLDGVLWCGKLTTRRLRFAKKTVGLRRRHGAVVPVGTKKMVERLVQTCGTGQMLYVPSNGTNEIK